MAADCEVPSYKARAFTTTVTRYIKINLAYKILNCTSTTKRPAASSHCTRRRIFLSISVKCVRRDRCSDEFLSFLSYKFTAAMTVATLVSWIRMNCRMTRFFFFTSTPRWSANVLWRVIQRRRPLQFHHRRMWISHVAWAVWDIGKQAHFRSSLCAIFLICRPFGLDDNDYNCYWCSTAREIDDSSGNIGLMRLSHFVAFLNG